MPSPGTRQAAHTPAPRLVVGRAASLAALILSALVLPAAAQYPGRTQKDAPKVAPPRAISVLEWVGDPGKPTASRIVPVTVFVNGQYEDGGLYLARPAPLAVETDTSYDLERAGVPQGIFDIAGGRNQGGSWFGYGQWKPLPAPKPVKKLAPSRNPPRVIEDHDPDRPRFKGTGDAADSSAKPADSKSTSPAEDPDKPTLHRKRDPANTDTSEANAGAPVADGPDRPHLKKRSDPAPGGAQEDSAVKSANEPDPDRPKLSRGKTANPTGALEATKLDGLPPELQQMTAVSDAGPREQHPFTYAWPSPDDAARMQAAVEALAIRVVLAGGAPPAAKPAAPRAPVRPGAAQSHLRLQVPPRPLPVKLSEEEYHSFELAYNGGPTMVLTAKALVGPNNAGVTLEKYVTVVAQPDFEGTPQLRLQSVTDTAHLDITPRMRLVDAADADGDNRAELLFELRRTTERQFALYKIVGTRAEQAFATADLPYGAAVRAENTAR